MLIVKTEKGQQVMKDRSVPLTPRQRSAFIVVDGKRTIDQVLAATASMGVTRADIDQMFEFGLIKDAGPVAAPPSAPRLAGGNDRSPQQRYLDAYPIATRLTASLGLRGFRLNLAVEAAGNYEELLHIAPKIRDAVGVEKFAPLEKALNG